MPAFSFCSLVLPLSFRQLLCSLCAILEPGYPVLTFVPHQQNGGQRSGHTAVGNNPAAHATSPHIAGLIDSNFGFPKCCQIRALQAGQMLTIRVDLKTRSAVLG